MRIDIIAEQVFFYHLDISLFGLKIYLIGLEVSPMELEICLSD